MAFILILVQMATGVLLKLVYEPTPAQAYSSILFLEQQVLFGQWMRNIHYWSANLLVIVAFLHFLRVFFTGAITGLRRLNWIIGLGLFLLIMSANFTGYLLPWDQLSYWAVTICINMLGYIPFVGSEIQGLLFTGGEIGPQTLAFFYWAHTAFLPLLFIVLLSYHFWKVRKAGGLIRLENTDNTKAQAGSRVPTIPNLLVKELAIGMILLAVLLVVSAIFTAPLAEPANPGLSPNPARAPWYFGGAQELLMHFHPIVAVLVIPLMVLALLVAIPFVPKWESAPGVWFNSSSERRAIIGAIFLAGIITPVLVFISEKGPGSVLDLSPMVSQGLIPLLLCTSLVVLVYWISKKIWKLTPAESITTAFAFVCTVFVILMAVNVWFRGASMVLAFPWTTGG